MSEHEALTHWVGEHNSTLHGNGAGSKDMEHVSGDEDEVTCRLCHNLLARMKRDLADECEDGVFGSQDIADALSGCGPMSAEHSSEEGGEGLSEAERIAAGRIRHGVGSSEDFPGNVCHLVSPIVGWMRLRERDGKPLDDLEHTIDRLSLVLDMARAEAARAEAAEAEQDRLLRTMRAQDAANDTLLAERDDLRGRLAAVEALVEVNERTTPPASSRNMLDAVTRATDSMWRYEVRAALANPSAPEADQ